MPSVRVVTAAAFASLLGALACSRQAEPPPPAPAPVVAPPDVAPAPAPPDAAVAAVADPAPPEPESPLKVCQRACSEDGNRKQMEGYVHCAAENPAPEGADPKAQEKADAKLGACRKKVLATTDKTRVSCRSKCDKENPKEAKAEAKAIKAGKQ